MARSDREFWESARLNNATFISHYRRITELGAATIKWKNCPETVNQRFAQLARIAEGKSVFFKDPELGFLDLRVVRGGQFDAYGDPTSFIAKGVNSYQRSLTPEDGVIVYNNYMRTSARQDIELFALRLYNIDRAIDLNVKAQKTPLIIQCNEDQRLTMLNMYKNYDGNAPIIYGTKELDPQSLKAFTTQAPYTADRLYQLKVQIWNEVLTYWGISNISYAKKERMVTDEVARGMGGVMACRAIRLNEQLSAAEKINRLFGLDVVPYFDENCTECGDEIMRGIEEEMDENL